MFLPGEKFPRAQRLNDEIKTGGTIRLPSPYYNPNKLIDALQRKIAEQSAAIERNSAFNEDNLYPPE